MPGFDHIIVALGSPQGDETLVRYAALLARLGGTKEIRFAHVADPSEPAAELRASMRAAVAGEVAGTGAEVVCDVLHGTLTDRLIAYVTEMQADLVIVGAKKHRLAARLAMISPCSVAVVPAGRPATLRHLMVAFDFSAGAVDTLQWSTALAAADPAIQCTALHVITHESVDLFADTESEAAQAEAMAGVLDAADTHGVHVVPRLAVATRSTEVGLQYRLSLPGAIEGMDVAHTILAEADACGADVVALSTRGRTRSAAILLGSVAEKVIERARVPLLVRRESGATLGLASILLGRAGHQAGVKAN